MSEHYGISAKVAGTTTRLTTNSSARYPMMSLNSTRIDTDLAVLEVTPSGLALIDIVDGLSIEELARSTPFVDGPRASLDEALR